MTLLLFYYIRIEAIITVEGLPQQSPSSNSWSIEEKDRILSVLSHSGVSRLLSAQKINEKIRRLELLELIINDMAEVNIFEKNVNTNKNQISNSNDHGVETILGDDEEIGDITTDSSIDMRINKKQNLNFEAIINGNESNKRAKGVDESDVSPDHLYQLLKGFILNLFEFTNENIPSTTSTDKLLKIFFKFPIILIAKCLSMKGMIRSLGLAIKLYPDQLGANQVLEILRYCNIHPDKYIHLIPTSSKVDVSNISENMIEKNTSVDMDTKFLNSKMAYKITDLTKSDADENNRIVTRDSKEFNIGILARWFISRVILLDSIGLTSYAAAIATIGVQKCTEYLSNGKDLHHSDNAKNEQNDGNIIIEIENLDFLVLKELSLQIQVFSEALYVGYLNDEFTFVNDWLGRSITERIHDMMIYCVKSIKLLKYDEVEYSNLSIVDCIDNYCRPMCKGDSTLYQSCSSESTFNEMFDILQKDMQDDYYSHDILNNLTQIRNKLKFINDGDHADVISKLLIMKSTIITDPVRNNADHLIEDAFDCIIVETLGDIVKGGNGLENLQIILQVYMKMWKHTYV